MSPLSVLYRDKEAPVLDANVPGEVELALELKQAFVKSLEERHISLRFFAGGWSTFLTSNPKARHTPYNLVLSSETIYEVASLPILVSLLCAVSTRSATASDKGTPTTPYTLEDLAGAMRISDGALCLVAAKVLYFGVGGGVPDFTRAVKHDGGDLETLWDRKEGVGRVIMRVDWP
jgi:protein-histidine N-methyltransferase